MEGTPYCEINNDGLGVLRAAGYICRMLKVAHNLGTQALIVGKHTKEVKIKIFVTFNISIYI